MRILLLGGSNTGMLEGYRKEFENNYNVTNKFLGASTSLYGLSVLMDVKEKYDLIFFEYTLNDISFYENECYSLELLADVLSGVLNESLRIGAKLVFLLAAPEYSFTKAACGECDITNKYIEFCKFHDIDYINLSEIFASEWNPVEKLYADPAHYSRLAHKKIFNAVDCKIKDGFSGESHALKSGPYASGKFRKVVASSFKVSGSVDEVRFKTSTFDGIALRLNSGVLSLDTCGTDEYLVAMLCNTYKNSGFVFIGGDGRLVKKNFFDGFYKEGSYRIFLKQLQFPISTQCGLEIRSLFDAESYAFDKTFHEKAPIVAPEQQGVELLSVLLWKKEKTLI